MATLVNDISTPEMEFVGVENKSGTSAAGKAYSVNKANFNMRGSYFNSSTGQQVDTIDLVSFNIDKSISESIHSTPINSNCVGMMSIDARNGFLNATLKSLQVNSAPNQGQPQMNQPQMNQPQMNQPQMNQGQPQMNQGQQGNVPFDDEMPF